MSPAIRLSMGLLGALMLALLGTAMPASAQVMADVGQVYTDPTFDLYNSGIHPRLDLRDIDLHPQYWRHKTLFVLALLKMQSNPKFTTDPYSYFQLAKVHGMPFGPYNSVVSSVWDPVQANMSMWWAGQCQHSNTVLGPWHRLYVAAYERALRLAAIEAAQTFTYDKAEWAKAADSLRLPRFDYADPRMAILGLPGIVTAANVWVAHPNRRPPFFQRIRNPMHSYKFQANPADPSLCTIAGGCEGTSFMPDKRLTPFMPWAKTLQGAPMSSAVGSLTFRWPFKNLLTGGVSSNHLLMDVMFRIMAVPMSLLQSLALSQPDYNCFWLGNNPLLGPTDYTCPPNSVASINDVHGLVHGLIGGISASGKLGGHMAPTESAAFDPMFWMLHSQLDYIWAMHQNLYSTPTSWVQPGKDLFGTYYSTPGSTLDRTTPLPPWQKPGTSGFFTSDDTEDYTKFGYTYTPIEKAKAMAASQSKSLPDAIKQVYTSKYNTTNTFSGYQWLATWDFPLSDATKVMPSSQFFAFASIKRDINLPFLNGASIDLPSELCGVGYNFATMPPPNNDAFQYKLKIVITRCIRSRVAPMDAANPAAGPIAAPIRPDQLYLRIVGNDGKDYSSVIKVPPPTLTWMMDTGSDVQIGSA